jgi:hypothetical protein
MQRCRYILECDLPPPATKDEIEHIKAACDQRVTAALGHSAKESTAKWKLPEFQLRGSIIRHILAGKRMFHKYTDDGTRTLLPGHIQANVTLEIGFDAYVEVVLMDKGMIIIHAHDHTPGKWLLPQ